MKLIYFIKLFWRNAALLIICPVFMFFLAYYLTKDMPKKYVSTSTIYTGIATGSSIVSMEEQKLDLFGTRSAFDNLINIVKSRSTGEEVGLKLFTYHMIIEGPDPNIISTKSYNELMEIVPDEVKQLVVKNDFEQTYQNFLKYKNKNYENFIYELIRLNHRHYSSSKILGELKATRVQSSDMIELRYMSDDPGICFHTLKLFNEVFIKQYVELKANQSDAVVNYFENQLQRAQEKLDGAENELLVFNKNNKIINYYEQTKSVASGKESFDIEYQNLKMKFAAAQSVLETLEQKLSTRQLTKAQSNDILLLRNQLADINLKIAMKTYEANLDSASEDSLIKEIADLKLEAYNLKDKLKNTIEEKFYTENSKEGLSNTTLLQDWLEKVIELESTRAMLIVAEQRQEEFNTLFQNYAPLGATMKRLERKIDVAEREYLSILHSLNLAKLKLQNLELNSNLKIAENPFYPIQPQPRKRKYIVLIAFMIGFIIPAFIILALDFLNQNIKNAQRAESFTKLKVASIYPILGKKSKNVDYDYIKSKASENLISKLNLKYAEKNNDSPFTVAMLSTQPGEGKTTIATSVVEKLTSFGYRCLFLTPNNVDFNEGLEIKNYKLNNNLPRVSNIKELITNIEGININAYNFIIVELPGMLNQPYPVNLLKNTDQVYLVTRANRAWKNADDNIVKDLNNITTKQNKPQLILNGVQLEEMESVLGEIPRKRSFIRRLGKNLLTFQFSSKKKINASVTKIKNSSNSFKIFLFLLLPASIVSFLLISQNIRANKTQKKKVENVIYISNSKQNNILTKPPNKKKKLTTVTREKESEMNNVSEYTEDQYYIIGGSFNDSQNAINFSNFLQKLNFQPRFVERHNNLVTVVLGIYQNKEEARQILNKYKKIDPKTDAWILKDYLKVIQPDNN